MTDLKTNKLKARCINALLPLLDEFVNVTDSLQCQLFSSRSHIIMRIRRSILETLESITCL